MKHLMFSVFDQKAMAFLPPWIMPREEQALRTFSDCCNSNEHQFGVHPEDYTLFRLGMWDDDDAKFTGEITPMSVAHGINLQINETGMSDVSEKPAPQVGDDPPVQPSSPSTNSS